MSSLKCINKIRWNYTKEDECEYVVEIDNISDWSRRSQVDIRYPGRKRGKYTWYTSVKPYRQNNFLSIELFVQEQRDLDPRLDLDCTVSIINSNGDKTEGRRLVKGVKQHLSYSMSTQFSDLPTMPRSSEVNDRLTLHFHVEFFRLQKLFDEQEIHVSNSTLGEDFRGLLQSGDSADIILTCQGVQFKAHKIILASRSSVFAAMFEKKDNEPSTVDMVDIVDMDADVLKQLLEYMYTDKANYIEGLANDLLSAAYKYNLEDLRISIEKPLVANLSKENAVYTLILAENHSADQLRKVTVQFIKDHKADVMKSNGWQHNMPHGPYAHLVAEFVD